MDFLGFKSSYGDPELWVRPGHKAGGTEYWEYVLLYVYDVLVVSVNGENMLRNEIGKYFELKEESVGPPKIYLGGKLSLVTFEMDKRHGPLALPSMSRLPFKMLSNI